MQLFWRLTLPWRRNWLPLEIRRWLLLRLATTLRWSRSVHGNIVPCRVSNVQRRSRPSFSGDVWLTCTEQRVTQIIIYGRYLPLGLLQPALTELGHNKASLICFNY